MIDSSARVTPHLNSTITVGAFTVIDQDVSIDDHSQIDSHVHIYSHTRIGKSCHIFQGAAVGGLPQDLKFRGEVSELIIGDRTVVREFATLNRGTAATGKTQIGSDCLLMAYVHVGHDSRIGNHVVLANNVTLGGHVEIGDYAGVGGIVPIHQFCRVGQFAFVGGGYRAVQDVPPFVLAAGEPLRFCGLNYVGLRRHDFSADRINEIDRIYHVLYREGLNRKSALQKILDRCPPSDDRNEILRFFESTERGVIK